MSRWWRRRSERQVPAHLAAGALGEGERLLAATSVAGTDSWLLATTVGLVEVADDGQPASRRAWHEVDAAAWEREGGVLTVTWVDAADSARWPLAGSPGFLAVVRERVQASVVVAEEVALRGRRRVRVVLRQDLSSRALLEQVLPSPATTMVPADQPVVSAALARLRDQAGLPPDRS